MAGTSLLALLDDIATLLDDVAVLTKVATKKTAGVLGDDLALNAEQVSGVRAERELPVVWAVAKGSAMNKLILVPAALLISAVASWLIIPLLMCGGAFLCFEGFEKIMHTFFHSAADDEEHIKKIKALADPNVNLVELEKNKIKGAIRTDFILSAEIVVIVLGVAKDAPFLSQVLVVSIAAALITIVVYSLVAAIVKLDDVGLYLIKEKAQDVWGRFKVSFGKAILRFAPFLMKTLSVVGTAAMFIVGGGILVHGIPGSNDVLHHAEEVVNGIAVVGGVLAFFTPSFLNALAGIIAGAILLGVITLGMSVFGKLKEAA